MIWWLFTFIIALCVSVATEQSLSPRENQQLFRQVEFAMVSNKPGSALAFRLSKKFHHRAVRICFRGECLQVRRRWQIFATDPQAPGKQTLVMMDGKSHWGFRRIHLDEDIFSRQHNRVIKLRLPASVVRDLRAKAGMIPVEKMADEKLYRRSTLRRWSSNWVLPVQSKVTSDFASLRVPPHGRPYSHTGVDLRASTGTPVRACSDGVVVGADEEVIFGNVITIDHGYGLMSRYMHLSSFDVEVGQTVKAGQVIGSSGATGRAEAPHLHWEMRVRGRPVDPLSTKRLLARLSDLE